MGVVYLVEHLRRGRREALKVLRGVDTMNAVESTSRFRREARAIHRLRHRSIITLYNFGRLPDRRFYLAMEYVEGPELSQLVRERPLELTRAVRLLVQLANAIDHAHSRGVVHRDLKPRNIVIANHEQGDELLKVLDFGVAKIVDPLYRDSVLSGKDVGFLGTPGYIAPELLTGAPTDPRSDLYSFGCIAFKMLTGRPPFQGRGMQVCEAHLQATPPRLCDLAPDAGIPGALDDLILRCLAKKPQDRFQTGREIVEALGDVPGLRLLEPGAGRSTAGPEVARGCSTTIS
jgi:serine/threonine-protein kinase